MWTPNAIFLLFALYFNIITIKEKSKIDFFIKKIMIPSDIISKKRDGISLSKNEIKWFISSYLEDKISECSNVITF